VSDDAPLSSPSRFFFFLFSENKSDQVSRLRVIITLVVMNLALSPSVKPRSVVIRQNNSENDIQENPAVGHSNFIHGFAVKTYMYFGNGPGTTCSPGAK
jgi:hypothetical protein